MNIEAAEWYDSIVGSYDELYGAEQTYKIKYIEELYRELFGSKLWDIGLDFGCGTGISTEFTKKYSKITYACDISTEMLKVAKAKHHDVKFLNCSEIKNKENYFDFITSITVLQDSENPEKILNILNKILKNEGLLIVSVLKKKPISYWKPIIKKYFNILWFDEEDKDYIFFLSKKKI